ncbi:MAG TPA: plastocyanin/azurin family copper-binding protein [Gammaproteobacteria bacterium]|nr:plastocyanin/azurin family copper-binding protein [Gammaproteobacteria bacterium]
MSQRFILMTTLTFTMAAAPGAFAGAGHGGEHGDHETTVSGHAGKPSEVDRTIAIAAHDIRFDRKRITVQPGTTVRFVITNRGDLVHDFTLGPLPVQRAHRREMADMTVEGGAAHHADANAVMIEPGETKTLIWTFGRGADLLFGCNVPGHFEAGMRGTVRVSPAQSGEAVADEETVPQAPSRDG